MRVVPAMLRGFSLLELIVFIIIVSVALAGVLAVMNLTTRHSADPLIRKQEIAVAESLLEEIAAQNFTVTGVAPAPTQANRASFDDISDYNGYNTVTQNAVFPMVGMVPVLTGYAIVNVTVAAADLGPAGSILTAASNTARLITVTVSGPDGSTVTLSAYRTAYGD